MPVISLIPDRCKRREPIAFMTGTAQYSRFSTDFSGAHVLHKDFSCHNQAPGIFHWKEPKSSNWICQSFSSQTLVRPVINRSSGIHACHKSAILENASHIPFSFPVIHSVRCPTPFISGQVAWKPMALPCISVHGTFLASYTSFLRSYNAPSSFSLQL